MHTRVLAEKGGVDHRFAIDDRIFLGEGLFETLRVANANPCFSQLHWQRLHASAAKLGIPFDITPDDWLEHLILQIKRDNLYNGGIKAILSGGQAPRGLGERGLVSQLVFQTFNYSSVSHPVRLMSSSWLRDRANPLYQIKSVNYLEAIMARRLAQTKGMDDVLFFNLDQCATETTCANLFLIMDNSIITPPVSDGLLPGITRSRIISMCARNNIPFLETSVSKSMLEKAEVIFTCNSLNGIRCVLAIDDLIFRVEHPLLSQIKDLLDIN
ncbi:MAG TPA: aminotransferase class IV [Legionella sp.]|nr:aminotransferase class IV [Legionella sp.]